MKVHVLSEQVEDPAIKLLAKEAGIVPLSLEEVEISGQIKHTLIVLSSILPASSEKLRRVCQIIYHAQYPMLFVPPWKEDLDITTVLDAPAHIVVGAERSNQIEVTNNDLRQSFGKDIARIRCDHYFVTPLQIGIMVKNKTGLPVLIRYRPNNNATPAYMTTVHLLSHSSRSDPLDRAKLLKSLLLLLNQQQINTSTTAPKESLELTPQELRSVVLALTQVKTITPASIQELLSDRLYISLPVERIQMSLDKLTESNVIIPSSERIIIDQAMLDKWIIDLDLRAYVRELNRE